MQTVQLTEQIRDYDLGGRHTHAAHQALRILMRRTQSMADAMMNAFIDENQSEGMVIDMVQDVLDAGKQRYGVDEPLSRHLLATLRTEYVAEQEQASMIAYPEVPTEAWTIHGTGGWYPMLEEQMRRKLPVVYVGNLTTAVTTDSPERLSTFYDGLTEQLRRDIVDSATVMYPPLDNVLYIYLSEYGDGAAYYEQVLLSALEHAAHHDEIVSLHMGWVRMLMVSFVVDTMNTLRTEYDAPDHWIGFMMKYNLPSVDTFMGAFDNLGNIPYTLLLEW